MNQAYVVDASALIDLLKGVSSAAVTQGILSNPDTTAHVPHLCDLEVADWVRKKLRERAVTGEEAMERISQYASLPLERHGHLGLLPAVMRLGKNFTAYDASYVALAELLQASLVTADYKLAKAARQHTEIPVITSKD